MLDIRQIRENPQAVEKALQRRDPSISLSGVLSIDQRRRELIAEEESLRARQNAVGPEVAKRKKAKEDASDLLAEMSAIKARAKEVADLRRAADEELEQALLDMPNIPHESVPTNLDKKFNQVVRTFGEKPKFDFEPQNHLTICERLGLVDFERGAKVTGAGFPVYRGYGAKLEWALINYFLACGARDGYEQVMPPVVVNSNVMTEAGVLPKFQDDVYHAEVDDLYLIATAEHVLTGLYGDEIIDGDKLPIHMTAYTPCFRREAGAHGANERGLIRIHQFNKTERYIICKPEDSYNELEKLTGQVEQMVKDLGLHFHTSLLVTGDIAHQAAKTYDVEVWLPGQDTYYEVSSCSNCEGYQARRGHIRFRPEPSADGKSAKPEFVHTLNGSALATPRLFVAILEQNQQADGSVVIPEALRPFMGGLKSSLLNNRLNRELSTPDESSLRQEL